MFGASWLPLFLLWQSRLFRCLSEHGGEWRQLLEYLPEIYGLGIVLIDILN
jgi:hypothetical protein